MPETRPPAPRPPRGSVAARRRAAEEIDGGIRLARGHARPAPRARRGLPLFLGNRAVEFGQWWDALTKGERHYLTPVVLCMILAVAFIARGFFFTGYSFSDDFAYSDFVRQIMNGTYNVKELNDWARSGSEYLGFLYGLRYGMLYPMAFLGQVFGATPDVFAGYHMLLSLVQILCLFWIMRRYFTDEIALAGALLLALFPIDILYASYVLPDSVIGPYMTIALFFFLYAMDRRRWWLRLPLYALAGVFLAGAHFSRVYAIFMVGVMGALLVYRRRFDPAAAGVALGFGLVFFLFNYPIWQKTGSWTVDLDAFSRAEVVFRKHFPVKHLWHYTTYFWHEMLENDLFVPFTLLFLGGAGAMAGLQNAGRFVPLIWFGGLFLVAEFGSARLTEFTPIHKLDRFMTMFSAPLAACAGVLVGRLANRKALFFASLFLLGLFVLIALRYQIPVFGVRP